MAAIGETKFVNFHTYCRACVNVKKTEDEDPCFECLCDPVNNNSEKPTGFVWDGVTDIPGKKGKEEHDV